MNKCPLCQSEDTDYFITAVNRHGRHLINENEKFDYWKCKRCGSLFLHNRYSFDLLKYYNQNYYSETKENFLVNFLNRFSFWRREELINQYNLKRGQLTILDAGCGQGEFLSRLNPKRYNAIGVEINKKAVSLGRKRNLEVYHGAVENFKYKNKSLDVVTMWHVLEHLREPKWVLKKVKRWLKPNGILIFALPNLNSLGFQLGKKNWFHFDAPRHIFLPTKKGIQLLLKSVNLNLTSVKYHFNSFPLDLLWSIRKNKRRFFIYSLYPLFKFFSKETLIYTSINKDG